MARIIKLGLEGEEYHYELSLDWDDEAFVEKNLKLDIQARRRHKNEDAWQEHTVTVSLEEDEELGAVIVITSRNFNEIIPLNGLLDESQLIDQLPAHVFTFGDPITGCLIRAGLSATIGQLIGCRNDTAGIEWFKKRAKEIVRCMKEHIPSMSAKMAYRAAKCISRGGF